MGYDSNDRDDGTFKRCPFCGGEASLRLYEPPFLTEQRYYYVLCGDCKAMTAPTLRSMEAIGRWNRRGGKGNV